MTDSQSADSEAATQLQIDWSSASTASIIAANQFLVQGGLGLEPDSIFLSVGLAAPPVVYGTEEIKQRAIAALEGRITIVTHARYVMPIEQARQLVRALSETLEKLDAKHQGSNDDSERAAG